MTLTVEYSEMNAKNVEHFKITATTSAHWVIPARTQEEYKQKEKISPRPHAHSHVFRRIRTLTYMTVSTRAYLYSSHTSWKEKKKKKNTAVHALRFKKKVQCKTSFYLTRVREVPVKPKVKVSEGNRCSKLLGARACVCVCVYVGVCVCVCVRACVRVCVFQIRKDKILKKVEKTFWFERVRKFRLFAFFFLHCCYEKGWPGYDIVVHEKSRQI